MAETATNSGTKTSEFKAMVGMVLGALATGGAALMQSGVIPDNSIGYVVVAALVAALAPVVAYITGRSRVKAATMLDTPKPQGGAPV